MKRGLDFAVALLGLALTWPFLLLLALAVRLDSPGPILFRQLRVGRNGECFEMLKLRSMVRDAERRGGYSTEEGDTRITRVGRLLRRTSLDELPQLFNVLRGDMSLVGPRPEVPAQRENYTEAEWLARHRVRPGITGLAQATLRSFATPEQRKVMDLEYAATRSLGLDLKILLLTVRQVIVRGGN